MSVSPCALNPCVLGTHTFLCLDGTKCAFLVVDSPKVPLACLGPLFDVLIEDVYVFDLPHTHMEQAC